MKLGQWLKQYRDNHNLSQPMLAERMGIEQSYLSKLENDKSMPSPQMLDDILQTTHTSLSQLLAVLDKSYVYNQLSSLPQVKAHLVNEKHNQQNNTNKKLFLFGLLLCLGCFVFYLGYGEVLENNRKYEYYSGGVLQPDEPLETLQARQWKHHLTYDEYQKRYHPKTILIDDYKLRSFVSTNEGERRFYEFDREIITSSGFNRMLKAIGVLSFSAGFFGLLLLLLNRKFLSRD